MHTFHIFSINKPFNCLLIRNHFDQNILCNSNTHEISGT